MDTDNLLGNLGLTDSERKVYLALLELGPSLAGRITRKTGIHRRNVYDITERLIKKGMVGYILKNNRRLFEAANPEVFLDIVKREEARVLEGLPFLQSLYTKTKEKQETNFYKGRDGLKTVFQDQVEDNKNGEILILGASKGAFEILPFYFKWYDKDRVKNGIKVKIIASSDLGKAIPKSEIRYLPEKYANPLAVNVYKDKVALILWTKNPWAVVIKEKEAAEAYKKYFEVMWRIARAGKK